MKTLHVDLDLVRKYNVAAPRYTSYPPATHFAEMPTEQVLERIRANNEAAGDFSLYFHLPFCRSLCWYCGCTTVITTQQSASATYLGYLKTELALMRLQLNPSRSVVQIHLGGGTPTFFLPDEIRELGALISSQFAVDENVEAGVEIDPRRLTREHVAALREAGFRRASVGVQDFDFKVQEAVHRIQTKAETEHAIGWLRDAGFNSLNIDLIYGLPHQTLTSLDNTLDEVIALRPQRIAAFSYAHVPWLKPAQKLLDSLPSPETKLALLKLAVEKLTSHGFVYIGMDHFACADDELAVAQREKTLQRNFQGYSTRGHADIYAFGMSSISQANGTYWQNHKEMPSYYAALDASTPPIARGYILSPEDKIRREVIMRLMCDLSLDFEKMSNQLGVRFADYFAPELASLGDLRADGLLELNHAQLVVTEVGRLLIRVIASRFDAYAPHRSEAQFSKTI
jgi:oxygen-independent coproporphyrinogen-3 oxidase